MMSRFFGIALAVLVALNVVWRLLAPDVPADAKLQMTFAIVAVVVASITEALLRRRKGAAPVKSPDRTS